MQQVKTLYQNILDHGIESDDRTGVGTYSLFGVHMEFDLRDGFPVVTAKKLAWRSAIAEMLWFLEGSTDERRLAEITYQKPRDELVGKNTIWTANADYQAKKLGYINTDLEKELGPVYGQQFRGNNSMQDQVVNVIKTIKDDPNSRRNIISLWNVEQIPFMALPPCPLMLIFRVYPGEMLHTMLIQRSADVFLGVPFNLVGMSTLINIIARETNTTPGKLSYHIADAHIYKNHVAAVKEYLNNPIHSLPKLMIRDDFKFNYTREEFPLDVTDNFYLINYQSENTIKAPMAV